MIVDPGDMELDSASERIVEEADAQTKKKIEVLHGYAATEPHGHERRIVLRFFASPLEIVGSERVEGVRVGRTELVDDGEGRLRAVVTEAEETIPCQLVFRSVGYRGMPLPGVPFDERAATIPNDHGRGSTVRAADAARASTSPAGSSAGPAASSARTRRTARTPSTTCSRTAAAGKTPPAGRRGPRRDRHLLAERAPDHITYAHWEAIDEPSAAPASPTAAPASSSSAREHLHELARGADALARD